MNPHEDEEAKNVDKSARRPSFVSQAAQYAEFVADHIEELDLHDTISLERREEQPYHDMISVRRIHNDTIFPYHTGSFCQWFAQKQTDPITRENLSYIAPFVQFKRDCLQRFSHIKTLDVTPEFLQQLASHWWQNCIKPLDQKGEQNQNVTDLARAFVDLHTLERMHLIHVDVDVEDTETLLMKYPVGTWLLRTSKMPNIIPYSEVFTVSGRSLERVVHNRMVYIYGVGYYRWNYSARPTRFVDMFTDKVLQPPVYVCLVDCISAMFRLWAPGNMLISADIMEQ
jgi:hypothetical protein